MKFADMNEREREIAKRFGYVGFVADRPTVVDAYDYAIKIAKAETGGNPSAITVGIHVLTNTWACEFAKALHEKEIVITELIEALRSIRDTANGDLKTSSALLPAIEQTAQNAIHKHKSHELSNTETEK